MQTARKNAKHDSNEDFSPSEVVRHGDGYAEEVDKERNNSCSCDAQTNLGSLPST